MLGYVKIDKGELKVREYEIYTGYYCGICKSIGKRYGQLPRMALSYDAAFLAVILASLSNKSDLPVQEHCIAHPLIKKKTIIRNTAVDYAADVMLLLAWYKLIDDANDEGKLYAKTTIRLLKKIYKKLQARYPKLCREMETYLSQLASLERERCSSIDMAAEAFSKIMELIFSEGIVTLYSQNPSGFDDPEKYNKTYSLMANIGYHMGKWIYMIDAADDIEENADTGAYNPLIYRFNYDENLETTAQFRERIESDLRFNLYHYLAILSDYIDSLDIKKNKGIIENVIYLGLNRKTEEIITRKDKDKQI